MSALPDIPERDLRGVNCCLCGTYEIREYTHQGKVVREPPPVCSPCRAERTGAIHLRLPKAVAPDNIAQRLAPLQAGTTPEYLAQAIQSALAVWAKALYDSADSVTAALNALGGRSDEERVAATLMGDPLVTGLEFVADHNGQCPGLKLVGLPGELARRIAERVPLAEGPALSQAHLAEILLLLAKAEDAQRKKKAQPTAAQKTPADGSDGDGA